MSYNEHLISMAGGDGDRSERKKALGRLRASLIAELWPEMNCSYFELPTWAQEYVDTALDQSIAALTAPDAS
jgi:hypothetical protein